MKKLCVLLCFCGGLALAQVGIGTTNPYASLDIRSTDELLPSNTDGLLIPKIEEFPVTPPTVDQDGMLVYATGVGSIAKGFYSWDNGSTSWVLFGGAKEINDLTDGKSDNDGTNDGSSIFFGIDAGLNDDGSNNGNIGIGYQTLSTNTDGYANVSIGFQSLFNNTTGNTNVGIGSSALVNNTSGSENSAIGNLGLAINTTGNNNAALGYRAGFYADGDNNTFIGHSAGGGLSVHSINGSVHLGYRAGYYELNNDRLYIENSAINSPLIYGEFDNDILGLNAAVAIGHQVPLAPLHVENAGTSGVQNIVAVLGSNASNRPLLLFSELSSTDLSSGMSLEYNGTGSGASNRMVINNVGGSPLFDFTNGGDFTLRDGDIIVRGTATDREIKLEDDAGNPDRALMRQTATQDIYVGDIDDNGGDLYLRAGGSNVITAEAGTGFVGINTSSPNALLEIRSTNETTPLNTDGLLIPKIEEFSATNPTAALDGMLVYATGNGSVTKGFYHWDANTTSWTNISPSVLVSFSTSANVTSNAPGDYVTDDFVFGSPQLDDTGNTDHRHKMFFDKSNAAFRAGRALNAEWNSSNIGLASTAFGSETTASGLISTAFGRETTASEGYSLAMGWLTTASGVASVSMGHYSVASGHNSIAMGSSVDATGFASVSMNNSTTASAANSTAMGLNTNAAAYTSTVLGRFNIGGGDPFAWANTDPLFEIGNGMNNVATNNALTVLKNGTMIVDGDIVIEGTATDRELRIEDDAGNNDRVLMRQTGTQDIYVGDIDNNGGDTYVRAGGSTEISVISGTGFVGVNTTIPVFTLEVNGNAGKPGGGSWLNASDRRLKKNINTYTEGLESIMKIEPVTYQYNQLSGFNENTTYVGVIAQDLQKIDPNMVTSYNREYNEYLAVDNSAMTYMLINAVKSQQAEIESLKREVSEIKNLLTLKK